MCVLAVGVRSSIPCEDNDFRFFIIQQRYCCCCCCCCRLRHMCVYIGKPIHCGSRMQHSTTTTLTMRHNPATKPFTIIAKTVTAENRRFLKSRHTIHSHGSSCDSWSGNSTAQAIFSIRKFKEYYGKLLNRRREIWEFFTFTKKIRFFVELNQNWYGCM